MSIAKGLFITGTDTNVGKTWVGSQLAAFLHQQGKQLIPYKPVESGCQEQANELIPHDASQYWNAIEHTLPLEQICPFRLRRAISPALAARLEGQHITLEMLSDHCKQTLSGDYVLVEGAGGFYSPLTQDALNADLAEALGHPVLLIAADRLGCLNQILLSLEAITQRSLQVAAVVLNKIEVQQEDGFGMSNAEELRSCLERQNKATPVIETSSSDWLELLAKSLKVD